MKRWSYFIFDFKISSAFAAHATVQPLRITHARRDVQNILNRRRNKGAQRTTIKTNTQNLHRSECWRVAQVEIILYKVRRYVYSIAVSSVFMCDYVSWKLIQNEKIIKKNLSRLQLLTVAEFVSVIQMKYLRFFLCWFRFREITHFKSPVLTSKYTLSVL